MNFEFNNNYIQEYGIKQFCDIFVKDLLKLNSTKLQLSSIKIGDEGIEYIIKVFELNIVFLNLYCCNITNYGIKIITESLICLKLENLILAENPIGDEGIKYFTESFIKFKSLKYLMLDNINISEIGIKSIAELLTKKYSKQLIGLSLGDNNINGKKFSFLPVHIFHGKVQ